MNMTADEMNRVATLNDEIMSCQKGIDRLRSKQYQKELERHQILHGTNRQNSLLFDISIRLETTIEDLRSSSRKRPLSEKRQVAGALLRDVFGFSLQEVAGMLNRDHSTIIHYCQSLQDWIAIGYYWGQVYTRLAEKMASEHQINSFNYAK